MRPGNGAPSRSRLAAGALAASLAVAGLTGCDEDPEVVTAAITAAVDAPPVEVTAEASPGVLGADEPILAASQLRLMLEQLLGEHVLLMAGAADDHADGLSTEAALAVVADNTDALTEAIALVYGDVGGRAFASLWSQHVAFFLDHARGTAASDHQVVDEASAHLRHYEQGFGSFTATATGGALPADAVTQLLAVHTTDINGYVAARLADDAELSATTLATGHDYAADIGATLAAAIAGQGPVAFPGDSGDGRTVVAAELARAFANDLAVRASGVEVSGAAADGGAAGAPSAGSAADAAGVAATAAGERLQSAVRAAADDVPGASAALERLTGAPAGTRADADALAASLGVPELGDALWTIATAPAGDPTAPELIEAHRAAYLVATTWRD